MHDSNSPPPAEVEVLLVEDNPLDVELVRELFSTGPVPCRLHVVNNGSDALLFLRQEGQFKAAPRPEILLLDLSLPDIDGLDVLSALRGDRRLLDTIVIVLSSAEDPKALCEARGLEASLYLRKHEVEGLDMLSQKLAEFRGYRVNIIQCAKKSDNPRPVAP